MGQGKGQVKIWVAPIISGNVIFEVSKRTKRQRSWIVVMKKIIKLLPIKMRFLSRISIKKCNNQKINIANYLMRSYFWLYQVNR